MEDNSHPMTPLNNLQFSKYKVGKKGLLKSNFIISAPQTLFAPDWTQLKASRCPLCLNRLAYLPSKKLYRCKGKKHQKVFVVTLEKMKSLSKNPLDAQ